MPARDMDVTGTLLRLLRSDRLSEPESETLFTHILQGRLDDAQIAAVLALIQARGPSIDELVGAARAMRAHVAGVPAPEDGVPLLDTAGTGGTRKTFNVSTAAAILAVAAAPGRLRIAKHGNRSRTGRGSAEVLGLLGVRLDAPPEVQARCLADIGICFCFAIHHHPAAKHAAGVRKSLGVPTIFNLLGPLTNPAGATRQLMGVYAPHLVQPIAQTLQRLGAQRAMVVHSDDGLDEISLSDLTRVAHLNNGHVTVETIDPKALGLTPAPIDAITARDVGHAVQMIRDVFAGQPGPARDAVALNAAAVLVIADAAPTMADGLKMAFAGLDSGAAVQALASLCATSNV
ncbi:MAG: anthranilate phosphoribosyltransferase [Phycisphaeraceae bacterium]|nr:anthranilate phosphoribosyltransferase [Phycisphaeraceae bacterium]